MDVASVDIVYVIFLKYEDTAVRECVVCVERPVEKSKMADLGF